MRRARGLATSGRRWGLSCYVENEAAMGVILGYMKLFGGKDIGFDDLGPTEKNPKNVAAGMAGGRPKGVVSHERGTLLVEARKVISDLPPEWGKKEFAKRLGWSASAVSRGLSLLIEAKEISRAKGLGKRGVYRTLPKLVKNGTGG